jgi:hypothetical protein
MRQKLKFQFDQTFFGTQVTLIGSNKNVVLAQDLDRNWQSNNQKLKNNFYWFRAPRITQEDLGHTVQGLVQMQGQFELEVWENQCDVMDASLKIADQTDAAEWAWTHTSIWQKWSQDAEKEFLAQQKPKATKIKVNKDGSVKVNVQVTTLSD